MRGRDEVLTVEAINDRLRELEAQQAASEPVAVTDEMVEAGCREHYEYTTGLRWDDANSTVQYMWRKDARIMLHAALTAASEGASDVVANQCDGCNAGMPLRDGLHHHDGRIYMGCTADRYAHPTTPTRGSDE